MSDRRFALLSLMAAAALVAGMAWHDLHPAAAPAEDSFISGYYAAANATPVSIPDDNFPVTIAQGGFSGAVYTPAGIQPFTLAQRQINLLFRLDDAALRAPAPVLGQIEKVIHGWSRSGSQISMLLIEAPAGDAGAYAAFLEALRKHFMQDPHVTVPVLTAGDKGLDALNEIAPIFAYRLDTAALPAKFMEYLRRQNHPFILILPAGAEKAGIDGGPLREEKLYQGTYVTIDPASPPVLYRQHRIGLWPRIFD